jgi:hypothetical protein
LSTLRRSRSFTAAAREGFGEIRKLVIEVTRLLEYAFKRRKYVEEVAQVL